MNNPMAQVHQRSFLKQFRVKEPRRSENILAEMCDVYRRERLVKAYPVAKCATSIVESVL